MNKQGKHAQTIQQQKELEDKSESINEDNQSVREESEEEHSVEVEEKFEVKEQVESVLAEKEGTDDQININISPLERLKLIKNMKGT